MTKKLHPLLQEQIELHVDSEGKHHDKYLSLLSSISETYQEHGIERPLSTPREQTESNSFVAANQQLITILHAMPDEFIHLTHSGSILYYHKGINNLLNIDSPNIIGKNISCFLPESSLQTFEIALRSVAKESRNRKLELTKKNEGVVSHFEVRMIALNPEECVVVIRDISEQKEFEQRTTFLAFHDSLTGLPNRLMFQDRLSQAIAHANRNQTMFAIMFLDLDRFKQINDTLGHSGGDELLITISQRLRQTLRETDTIAKLPREVASNTTHTIARLGGDEFTLILSDLQVTTNVSKVARRILHTLSRPLHIGNQEIYTSASIGIAIYPNDGEDLDTLIKNADAAMYHAKEKGRNNFQLYSSYMNAESAQQIRIENSLRHAINNDGLYLEYQPQFELTEGRIVGVEALIRWKHEELGLMSPNYFITLAEEADLIQPLGEYVIEKVCKEVARWKKMDLLHVPTFMNLSAQQLQTELLTKAVLYNLQKNNLKGSALGLELTETALMKNPDQAVKILKSMQALGLKIAIDDFGTGYSSLSNLKRFSLHCIKIDKSFIGDVLVDPDDEVLSRTIINMGHNLGLEVIAEGIENDAQVQWLRENKCHQGQGYHLCAPLPPDKFVAFVKQYKS